ncbi:MAG TPA: hypothetical protein VJB60_02400 [Candidatus Peribacterales bacterium]|nr:hypothetical protein [Candidatus Peribacterales bacterium]
MVRRALSAAATCMFFLAATPALAAKTAETSSTSIPCSQIQQANSIVQDQKTRLRTWEKAHPRKGIALSVWLQERRAFTDSLRSERTALLKRTVECGKLNRNRPVTRTVPAAAKPSTRQEKKALQRQQNKKGVLLPSQIGNQTSARILNAGKQRMSVRSIRAAAVERTSI